VKDIPVLLEGPYGHAPTTTLCGADTILAVAGGIGITSILGYLESYLQSHSTLNHAPDPEGRKRVTLRATRFVLFWSAREESLVRAIKSQLADVVALERKGVDVTIVCTNGSNNASRSLNIGEVVRGEVLSEGNIGRKVCVISCGPGRMSDAVRATVVDCIGKNGVSIKLIEESFCW
jgi:hypothetical protein